LSELTFHQLLVWLCAVYWLVALALLVVSTAATLLQPLVAARRARNAEQPPVSVILPVKSLEHSFQRAQESVFAQNYPDFEVLASARDPSSPAAQLMKEIFARRPEIETRFLRSTSAIAVSPKVDNLVAPISEAQNDVIFTKDSNVTLLPEDLRAHMRQLTPGVGFLCAIPYAADPENLPAHIEASILNGPHARMLYLASCLGQGFGVGKIMLFRRGDLVRAGGFAAIAHTVGEDNALAKAMRRIGLRTAFSHCPARQELGLRSWSAVFQRQLRWSVIRRDEVLFSFLLEPLSQAAPGFFAAWAAAPVFGLGRIEALAATFLLWLGLESLLSFLKGWRLSWAAPAVLVMREGMMIAVWLRAWTTSRVIWADEPIDARAGAVSRADCARASAQNKG